MPLFLKAPAPVPNGIDPAFFNQVAQFAHFGTMFTLAITCAIFAGKLGLVIAMVFGVIYALWHEFYYDPRNENPATRGSDLEDFGFLLGGLAVAALVWYLGTRYGRII
jgi:predicted outer membrane lipoprotein